MIKPVSQWLKGLWNPAMYHGWSTRHSYFEGWYLKIVDPEERFALAIIPGIAMTAAGEKHAFIQVLDGKNCQAHYFDFPAADFVPAETGFDLQLGNNRFSAKAITLDLPWLKGDIRFNNTVSWPGSFTAPGVMGWYSFAPFMECYHGIVSMNHDLEGTLDIHGTRVDFTGGKGYIEKDWGKSFPRCWIWSQNNHFDGDQPASLMASVAHIPWLGNYFVGHIVALWISGKWYKFATYTGSKYTAQIRDDVVRMTFSDRKNRLDLVATPGPGAPLRSPITGNMTGKVNESLQATIAITLYEGDRVIFKSTGRNAGLEVAGDTGILITN